MGCSDADLRRWRRSGELVALRRGVFALGSTWRAAPPWERQRIRALAVYDQVGRGRALSHHSALAVHRVQVFGVDERVHFVPDPAEPPARKRERRAAPTVSLHPGVPAELLVTWGERRTVTVAAAVAQVAASFGAEAGLVSADSALNLGRMSRGDLRSAIDTLRLRVGRRTAELVAKLADGRSESSGETRVRWLLHQCGIGDVEPQAAIIGDDGRAFARVDLLVDGVLVVEYDGESKYGAADSADFAVLKKEKRREDRIRRAGFDVERVVAADLWEPAALARRLATALATARERYGPVRGPG